MKKQSSEKIYNPKEIRENVKPTIVEPGVNKDTTENINENVLIKESLSEDLTTTIENDKSTSTFMCKFCGEALLLF